MSDEALLEERERPDLLALASFLVTAVATVLVLGATPLSRKNAPTWLACLCVLRSQAGYDRNTYPFCPVHQPIRHHEIPRPHLLFQAAHRAEPDRAPDAQFPQAGDVGPEGYFVRGIFMMQTVARQEGDDDWFGGWIGGAVG